MKYATPAAFKEALETRIRQRYPSSISRVRQLFVFSRYLARVVQVIGNAATLKGGVALELRLAKARTTKDIDLSLSGLAADRDLILERLQDAARLDLGDYLVFEIQIDPEHPDIDNEAMQYDGSRLNRRGKRKRLPWHLKSTVQEITYSSCR